MYELLGGLGSNPGFYLLGETGTPPLGGRCVDIDKGDDNTPDVRCRYVAKDLALVNSDEFFAAVPPLEALRMILSYVATGRKH